MDTIYWLKRWREGRTGWQRDEVMPLLVKHWTALAVARGTQVLVPFCGKTLDMIWLAEQGLRVLGVEVSPFAIEQFFADNKLEPTQQKSAGGLRYRAGDIEIIQRDLFDVSAETLAGCGAIYDRAAIIAQPAPERRHYAQEVYTRLPVDCRGLMMTLEYPQAEMDGLPFSVGEGELRRLFGAAWDVAIIERRDITDRQPDFREAGLTSLHTAVYRLDRHSQSFSLLPA